jgi:hypothetical protein
VICEDRRPSHPSSSARSYAQLYIKDAHCLETNGNGWECDRSKLLKTRAGTGIESYCQLPKMHVYDGRRDIVLLNLKRYSPTR